jgi:hypothetical protein
MFGRFYFGEPEEFRSFFRETCARFSREASRRTAPGGVLVLKNPEISKVLLDFAELFPEALFLATVRDPRDQVASELEIEARREADGVPRAFPVERPVAPFAAMYVDYFAEILKFAKSSLERMMIVRYEELVLRTHEVLEALGAFTGLDLNFDPDQTWPRVSPMAALQAGPSRSDLYGGPINARSVGRFRQELNAAEIAAVEEICGDLMAEFAYEGYAPQSSPTLPG